jgi:hypothetical protein
MYAMPLLHSIQFLSPWNLTEFAGILFVSSPHSELFPSSGRHNTKQWRGIQALGYYWVDFGDWNLDL